jgi:hypothetical protein
MESAAAIDPGFDPLVFADMLDSNARFTDEDIPLRLERAPQRVSSPPIGSTAMRATGPAGDPLEVLNVCGGWHDFWHDEGRSSRAGSAVGAVGCAIGAGGAVRAVKRRPRNA